MVVDVKKVNKFALDMALNANKKIFSFLAENDAIWYCGNYCGFCAPEKQAYIKVETASSDLIARMIGLLETATEPLNDTKNLIRSVNNTLLRVYVTDGGKPVYLDDKLFKYFPKQEIELFGREHNPEKNAVVVRDKVGDAIGIIMPTRYYKP